MEFLKEYSVFLIAAVAFLLLARRIVVSKNKTGSTYMEQIRELVQPGYLIVGFVLIAGITFAIIRL